MDSSSFGSQGSNIAIIAAIIVVVAILVIILTLIPSPNPTPTPNPFPVPYPVPVPYPNPNPIPGPNPGPNPSATVTIRIVQQNVGTCTTVNQVISSINALPTNKRAFFAYFNNSGIASTCSNLSIKMTDSQAAGHSVVFFWSQGVFRPVGFLSNQASNPRNSIITFTIGT
jgi:hypothetical protein